MNENIKKFLEKVQQSPELQAQFSQIRDPEEAYKLAATVQDGFTKEEFVTEMTKLYEAAIQDLSDEDIAKVAGGDAAAVTEVITIISAVSLAITLPVGEAVASGAAV